MRTTLLLTAALGVAGAATTMAQVYSVNAVGYVNSPIKVGYNLMANPLDNKAGNKVSELFKGIAPLTIVKYKNGAYGQPSVNDPDPDFGWTNGDQPLAPGEGAFVQAAAAANVTFVGEVMQGDLSNPLIAGYNMVSSMVPQEGLLVTALGFPKVAMTVYTYAPDRTPQYLTYAYDPDPDIGGWGELGEPTIKVGEAFWVQLPAAATWARTFSVNTP